jgi:septal ring factor EnvC (AmiA/AmiB activator)
MASLSSNPLSSINGSATAGARALVAGVCLVAWVWLAALPSAQQDPARTSERASERIRVLLREADALAAQQSKLLGELKKLEADRQTKVAEVTRVERDLQDTQRRLDDARAKTDALKKTADAERPDVVARMVHLYKMGSAGYWRMLFDVDDLRSMGRAYRTAAALTRLDRERVQAHQRTLNALAKERKDLEAKAQQLAKLQDESRRARAALERSVAAHNSLIDSIDARRDLNTQMTSELEAVQQRLQSSLNQVGTNGAAPVSLPVGAFQGALPWPARGSIISRFGRQTNSKFGTAIVKNGVEIAVPEGVRVAAVHEGTVAYADQFTGYGNLVIVEHGEGAFSLYGHLASVRVGRGDRVEPGTTVGTTGRNPGGNPALYFELRIDGRPVDPLQWLQKGSQ